MGRIYNGQTKLRIRLDTSQNISGADAYIKYKKPSGKTGTWTATVDDAASGTIYYAVGAGDIDEAGQWKFWAYITFGGGLSAPGKVAVVQVYDEGD